MTLEQQAFGARGERLVESWLTRRGWRLLARRFRSGHRDIDLIVERDDVVAFVEVKTRRPAACGHAVEAVNWRKRRELVRSAHVWLERNGRADRAYRFDVVGVTWDGDRVVLRHVENAFDIGAFR